MSSLRTSLCLGGTALLVGWYQLPVLTERSQALTLPGHERITELLESATAGVGQPAVLLRTWGEQQKLNLQAYLVDAATVRVVHAARPAPAAPAAPVLPQVAPPATPVIAVASLSSTITQNAAASAPAVAPAPLPAKPSLAAVPANPGPEVLAASGAPALAESTASASNASGLAQEKGVVAVLAGDSVMGEIAFGMKRWAAKNRTWTVVDAHKVSSGLSNQGYYDWPSTFRALLKAHKPGVALMMVGANDGQDIYESKKRHGFGSESWRTVYGQRVQTILTDASSQCLTLYWVLQPVVREPGMEKKMEVIRTIIREKAHAAGNAVHIIDTNTTFTDGAGRYTDSAKLKGKVRALRTDDGVHLTYAGAQVLVDAVLEHASAHPQAATPACSAQPAP